jgi:hypothetical protein
MGQASFTLTPDSVPTTARKLLDAAAHSGAKAHHLAEDKMEECRVTNDMEGMRFWRSVWIHLMSDEYLAVVIQNPRSEM